MDQPDDPQNYVMVDLMVLWTTRAERKHTMQQATTTFRRALLTAIENNKIPISQVAAALGIDPRAVRRHLSEALKLDTDNSQCHATPPTPPPL